MLTQPDEIHHRIHAQGRVFRPCIKPSNGPSPIRRLTYKPTADRIVVNIVHHRVERIWFLNIAIITSASLPEAIMDLAIGLEVPQPFEKLGCLAAKICQSLSLHRNFECGSNQPDFIDRLPGPDDDMDMLRHNHVSPNEKITTLAGPIQGYDKPLPASVLA